MIEKRTPYCSLQNLRLKERLLYTSGVTSVIFLEKYTRFLADHFEILPGHIKINVSRCIVLLLFYFYISYSHKL